MSKFNCLMTLTTIVLLLSASVFADQIVLKSGDRLTGKVLKQDDEKIVLQTNFAGIITISKTTVEKVSIEETIAKENFVDKNENENAENKATVVKTSVETGGSEADNEIQPAKNEIQLTKKDESADASAAANAKPAKQSRFGFISGWDGSANVGFNLTAGNSRTATFMTGIRAEKTSEKHKWTTYLNSLWNRNRVLGVNLTTSNAVWGGIRYDRNITKKVFAYGSFDFERDIPQLLNFRSVLGGGLGYHLIKNDRTELDVFSGVVWNRSWYTGPNTSNAEAVVGNTLKHKFNERLKLQQGFMFYPSITDGSAYRFIWDSTLTADMTKRFGVFITLGDRFNSAPVFGAQKMIFCLPQA